MKLRQKLAVVLASAMTVTAVPVVTMAASTNSLTKETVKVQEDCEFTNSSTANALKVKFTDNNKEDETFYLDLDNADWDKDTLWTASQEDSKLVAYTKDNTEATNKDDVQYYVYDGKIEYTRQSDSSMKIFIDKSNLQESDTVVQIPLFVKAKDGDAKVSIENRGGTTVTESTFVFATTAEKKMSVAIGEVKTFYTSGKIAEITIEESYKGALKDGGEFTIELDDADYYFVDDTITLEGKYGFSAYGENKSFKAEIDSKDDGRMTVKLPAQTGSTRGTWVIKDVEVKSTDRKPEEGDFLADIKGDDLTSEKTNAVVAKVSEHGVYVKMKDDKAEDVKAGRIEEVEFEIGESVEDSMITGREFEMTLENGHWDYKEIVKEAHKKGKLSGKVDNKEYDTAKEEGSDAYEDEDFKKWATKVDSVWLAEYLLDNDKDWDLGDNLSKGTTCEAEFDVDNDGEAIVETIFFTIGTDKDHDATQNNDDCDKLKFKTNICVPIDNKEKSKVTIKVAGRGVDNEASTTAINILNPFNVTFEQAVLKTGLQNQVSGSVTIKETDKDMLQKGDVVFKITKDDEDFGIYIKDVDVEVSDGLKGTKVDITKGKAGEDGNAKIELTLNRASKEAATITFKNMKFTTDRTVPEGTYDLEISGKAIDEDGHKITVADFIKISTANTEEITANGLAKGTAKFVIGESKYTLNDKTVEMDAPSYIQNPGYTMVPVRYVANAFGIDASDIVFGKGTATLFAGGRTISLTSGSAVATVNGSPVTLATAVVNKDGRMYVPAGQLASLLGIKTTWDDATKTATFEN